MKKIILNTFSVAAIALAIVLPVSAQTVAPTSSLKGVIKDMRKDLRIGKKEVRQDVKEIQKTIKNKTGKIVTGQVSAVSGSTLTVTKDGKTYTVNTDGSTQFRRHFWGKSSLSEISVGDKVNVIGKFTDDTQTTILAKIVRDVSIQKRFGAFLGDVTSKSADSFVIKSVNRGNQTVNIASSTKFVGRNEAVLTFVDIQVGHRVRVKGIWDKTSNKITEVSQVKDFSLPARVASPTPSTQQ